MTISKTIGSGGAFSTINAWVSWVQANAVSGGNLTDSVVGNILQAGITPTASDTISGWAPGGSNLTTTLQANPGGGFKDNANAQTNALAFNTANGAYIDYSGTSGTFLTISVNLCTVQYLQIKTAGQYKYAINFTSTLTSATINANIFDATNGSNAVNLPTSGSAANTVVKNNAVFWDNTSRQGRMFVGNNYLAYNNTFGGTASSSSAIGCFATGGYPIGTVITNNLCVALSSGPLITAGNHYASGITGSNNANTGASIMNIGTGATGTTGITGSNEVQGTASDLRLNPTSTVCKDGGTTVASVTVDIVGTTRPRGSAYDIGCWELVQFNPAWAQGQGVIGDTAMYLKNTAGQYLGFALINATNGSALTGATVTAYRAIDGGAQASATGTVSELGNGQYQLAMSQADTNGNDITFLFTATNAVPVEKSITTSATGGGTPAYFSTSEVYHDLSSGSLTLTVADIGKTHILYSSVDGQTATLPAANASGIAQGHGIGFRVLPRSKPIKILNAGTAGTDAILEAFALPGADFTLFANSVSSAAGDWKGSGKGLFHGPVPVTIPNVSDVGVDLGSAILTTSFVFTGTIYPNVGIVRLSPTLYVFCTIPNAGTSVVCYAISYNPATDVWMWGTPVTAFSSANQWEQPYIVALTATTYAILSFETTATLYSARAATVSGTTITQGTIIQSGAWGVNPPSGVNTACMVQDSASTFFYAIAGYDGTPGHLGILHFSVSGTTLTQDGGAAFTSATAASNNPVGVSPTANNLDLNYASASGSEGISRFNYAGGTVTNTFNRRSKIGSAQAGTLYCVDTVNRVYYSIGGTRVSRYVLNAGATDITEQETGVNPTLTSVSAPVASTSATWMPLTDSEAIAIVPPVAGANTGCITLFDPTLSLRARIQLAATANADSGASSHIVAANMGWGPQSFAFLSMDVNQSNRRLAMIYTFQTQTIAAYRQLSAAMFDLPRNYDQATQ